MTLINEVKKALCRTRVEMDAGDIADHLARQPGRRGRPSRNQVARALATLAATEPDIIRTRPGLYRYQPVTSPTLPLPAGGRTWATDPVPAWTGPPDTARAQVAPAGEAPAQITADEIHVREQLRAHLGAGEMSVNVERLTAYLLGVATACLGPARLTWCTGATATTAEVTRQQCAGRRVVAIASPQVVAEAAVTARTVGPPIRVWTIGPPPPDHELPHGPEIAERRALDLTGLRAACRPAAEPTVPPSALAATQGPDPRPAAPASRRRPAAGTAGLDSLWQLDVALHQRRVEGVTGRGNTHTLKRQALLLGRTYAHRWCSVVTDETRERLDPETDQAWLPDRLYRDLLTFAETHGLPVHGSQVIKDLLRRGFWQLVRGDHDHRRSCAA